MNVPEGFKQTEVGVIPQDWEVVALGELTEKVGSGITPTGGQRVYKEDGRPFMRSQNVGWGSLLLDDVAFIDDAIHATFLSTEIQLHDVFLNITGASIGRSAIADSRVVFGNVNQHVCIIRTDNSKLSPRFLNYFLLSANGQMQIDIFQAGGNRQGLNFSQVRSIRIAKPKNIKEQTAIAAALSDMDALIEGVEKLLEKKRRIKQGAMQELLTGKKRVSGFESKKGFQQTEVGVIPKDWGLTSLMEHIAALDAGVSVNSVDEKLSVLGHSESVLKTSCVYNGYFYPEECKKILPKDVSRAKLTPKKNSIIISRMNTPTLVGECGFIANNYPSLFLPDRLWQTSFKNDANINARWLAYILSFGEISKSIKEIATGTSDTMKNIAKNALLKVKIPYPTKSEQTSIAAILSDMDAEIEQLEAQLTKYRQLKTGMMQELLTGKKRLV